MVGVKNTARCEKTLKSHLATIGFGPQFYAEWALF